MSELKRRRSETPYLPEEILSNILVRLPVKHILRFKTVCKAWRALILSDDFVKLHLDYSNRSPRHEDDVLVFWGSGDRSLYAASLDSSPGFEAVKLDLKGLHEDFVDIMGSCNGLILCKLIVKRGQNSLVLVNPSTLRYKRLPMLLPLPKQGDPIGFGYDHITDDYKVVMIRRVRSKHEMSIYSLRADSWREVTIDVPILTLLRISRHAMLMNNHLLHWYTETDNNEVGQVLCFDITTEKWSEIPLPECTGKSIKVTDVGVQNGFLCISCKWQDDLRRFNDKTYLTYVWVMKEYGVKDSWVELLNKTQTLGVKCQHWGFAPIANYAQRDRDGDEIWLMKLMSGVTRSKLRWYAKREGKQGKFSPNVEFTSYLVNWCHTGCNRTLVPLDNDKVVS